MTKREIIERISCICKFTKIDFNNSEDVARYINDIKCYCREYGYDANLIYNSFEHKLEGTLMPLSSFVECYATPRGRGCGLSLHRYNEYDPLTNCTYDLFVTKRNRLFLENIYKIFIQENKYRPYIFKTTFEDFKITLPNHNNYKNIYNK